MSLLNRKFDEDESGMEDRTDCLCKFRGTPEEQQYHEYEEYEETMVPGPEGGRNLTEDMTLGQIVQLLNYLVKEVNEIKRSLDG